MENILENNIKGIIVKYHKQIVPLTLEEVKIVIIKYLELTKQNKPSNDNVINFLFTDFNRIDEMIIQQVKNNMLDAAFNHSVSYIEKEYSLSKLLDKEGRFIKLVS
jgi:hypothetical protein